MSEVMKGQRYRHFKGGEYEVLEIAIDSESLKKVVVYLALYDSEEFGDRAVWVRDYDDFCGWKVLDDGERVERFELVEVRDEG